MGKRWTTLTTDYTDSTDGNEEGRQLTTNHANDAKEQPDYSPQRSQRITERIENRKVRGSAVPNQAGRWIFCRYTRSACPEEKPMARLPHAATLAFAIRNFVFDLELDLASFPPQADKCDFARERFSDGVS